ncbi:hypothetical protein CDD82_3169 [Ophiocordyceps australis]|uniref:Matrin-type domain-containing protein n=1 Tax=Ophiocordyceps australis TaxID=1399860 RepID=A0A2C5ZFH9_9HYPO|nr:hypothetical protein CDD82_3169 [Ophiocordyceps australis]
MSILEKERFIHEDLERLEQGISDRVLDEYKHIRNNLKRDHEIAQLLGQIQQQSQQLVEIFDDASGKVAGEIEQLQAGDPFAQFYNRLNDIRERHSRYSNEQAENLELRYKPRRGEGVTATTSEVDTLFTGEEAYGRFFDLNLCHQKFLNLSNAKRLSYLQYLEDFDNFTSGHGGLKRTEKMNDEYLQYLAELANYLISFKKRTKPLESMDKILSDFDAEFAKAWENGEMEGWQSESKPECTTESIWCADCEKYFASQGTYNGHLSGRKHKRAAEKKKQEAEDEAQTSEPKPDAPTLSTKQVMEKAIAQREFRIKRLASSMSTERSDTRVNVERKQGMTERERQQELDILNNIEEMPTGGAEGAEDEDEDGDDKIYNPLKLPLAWDGKPIPFWLYRLHGLGVEFHCQICGNFVYMGRRAFDKHFGEQRHIYGLKCLGITQVGLFRDITKIEEALKLWEKLQQEEKKNKLDDGSMVQMEDGEGNVMPEKVYLDLQKQGLL